MFRVRGVHFISRPMTWTRSGCLWPTLNFRKQPSVVIAAIHDTSFFSSFIVTATTSQPCNHFQKMLNNTLLQIHFPAPFSSYTLPVSTQSISPTFCYLSPLTQYQHKNPPHGIISGPSDVSHKQTINKAENTGL